MKIIKMQSKLDFKTQPTTLNVHVTGINEYPSQGFNIYFGKIDGEGKEYAFNSKNYTIIN